MLYIIGLTGGKARLNFFRRQALMWYGQEISSIKAGLTLKHKSTPVDGFSIQIWPEKVLSMLRKRHHRQMPIWRMACVIFAPASTDSQRGCCTKRLSFKPYWVSRSLPTILRSTGEFSKHCRLNQRQTTAAYLSLYNA